jgi:ABC-type molybdenum transport system ATPase subunit/photorepair protein PhrA
MHTLNTTPLNPHILSTPFQSHTRWYVLTGAACVGKTTLLKSLAGQGYRIIPESARAYFEREQAKGRTLPEIRSDDTALQHGFHSSFIAGNTCSHYAWANRKIRK